jgi:hypothetical protein
MPSLLSDEIIVLRIFDRKKKVFRITLPMVSLSSGPSVEKTSTEDNAHHQ